MKNDGGKAFPEIISDKDGTGQYDTYSFGGMTLRDYFAGQALAGLASLTPPTPEEQAHWAYTYADAMLAERQKEANDAKN